MREIIVNIAACIIMAWCGVIFFALTPITTQPWIFVAGGVICFAVALHFLIEAIRVKL